MSGEVAQEEEEDDEEDEAFLPPLVVGSLAFERCSLAEEEEPLVPWWPEEPPWSLDIRAVGLPEEVEEDEDVFLVLALIVTDDFLP